MRRAAVIILVLFGMLWQSMALARVGSPVNPLADLPHAVMHWQGESHHHHEDGSYHLDDSKESVQHMVADHLGASLVMAAPSLFELPRLRSAAPAGLHATPAPSPTLDGLLRPPRLRF